MAKAQSRWTPEEDRFLREYHGVLSGEKIARRLGRTLRGCGLRASKLGIKSSQFGLNKSMAARELGVTSLTLERWITEGLLQTRKGTTYEKGAQPFSYIPEEQIVQFLQAHCLAYNPARLAERWRPYVPWEERANWISIRTAQRLYSRSSSWFRQLVYDKRVRAKKGGWSAKRSALYLYRKDLESAEGLPRTLSFKVRALPSRWSDSVPG